MLKKKIYIPAIVIVGVLFCVYALTKINSDGELVKIGEAPKFEFLNQDRKLVTNETYKGKVYVLEFFFSTCPTICPIMNRNMLTIERKFLQNPNFGIVSITINPDNDTPEVLKAHAKELGVQSGNWNFLTGDRKAIYELSNKGFNIYAAENKTAKGGFEHSGLFALVDKDGYIRCRKAISGKPILYYKGLEAKDIEDIITDIDKLLKE